MNLYFTIGFILSFIVTFWIIKKWWKSTHTKSYISGSIVYIRERIFIEIIACFMIWAVVGFFVTYFWPLLVLIWIMSGVLWILRQYSLIKDLKEEKRK